MTRLQSAFPASAAEPAATMRGGRLHAALSASGDERHALLHGDDEDEDGLEVLHDLDALDDDDTIRHGTGSSRVRDLLFADEAEDLYDAGLDDPAKAGPVPADFGYRLLDRALDEVTGKFQILLTALCALANFVDAAEVMMMGLLYPSFMKEFGLTERQLAVVPSLGNVGKLIGALSFGTLSDTVGRRTALIASLSICILFGFLSSFANNVVTLAIMRMLLGFGYGGNLVSSTTLLVEFLAHNERGVYTMWCGVGFGVGALTIAALSWYVIPRVGWRWLMRIAAFISLPVLCMLFLVPESPRYYLMRHQYYKCVRTIDFVARFNGKEIPRYLNAATLNVMHYDERQRARAGRQSFCGYEAVMRKSVLVTLVPLAACWFLNAFANVLNIWIPTHGRRTFSSDSSIVYEVALIQAAGILAGTLAQVVAVRYFSRRLQIRVGFVLSAVSLILLGLLASTSLAALYTLAFVIQVTEQIIILTLFLYTPECFPTGVRVTAFGICQASHRFAPIVAPYAVAALDTIGFDVTCYVFAGVFLLGGALAMFLHVPTFNVPLVEDAGSSPRNAYSTTRNPQDPEFTQSRKSSFSSDALMRARPAEGVL